MTLLLEYSASAHLANLALWLLLICFPVLLLHVFFLSFSLLLLFLVLFFLSSCPPSPRAVHSSRRVHFERINTVPIKGHRAGRHSFRRHQSLSRTLLRYRGVQEAWRGSSHTQPTHKGTCSRGTVPSLAQSASVLKL